MSMREHDYFRLYVSIFANPPTEQELAQTELFGKVISEDDPLTRRMTEDLPDLYQFGEYWSWQVERTFKELALITPDNVLTVTFEDLMSRPEAVLQSIGKFFELPPNESWLQAAVGELKGDLRSRFDGLDREQQQQLERACRPGQHLLGRGDCYQIEKSLDMLNRYNRALADRQKADSTGS